MFANAGAHGYYRTAYPPEMLRAIAPHVETDLTRARAAGRCSTTSGRWCAPDATRAGDYLTLAAGFGREHTSGVLEEVAGRLGVDATSI